MARIAPAVALPCAVGWLVTIGVRRNPCSTWSSYLHLLWGAPGIALACSIGVTVLLLTSARLRSAD